MSNTVLYIGNDNRVSGWSERINCGCICSDDVLRGAGKYSGDSQWEALSFAGSWLVNPACGRVNEKVYGRFHMCGPVSCIVTRHEKLWHPQFWKVCMDPQQRQIFLQLKSRAKLPFTSIQWHIKHHIRQYDETGTFSHFFHMNISYYVFGGRDTGSENQRDQCGTG